MEETDLFPVPLLKKDNWARTELCGGKGGGQWSFPPPFLAPLLKWQRRNQGHGWRDGGGADTKMIKPKNTAQLSGYIFL